MELLEMVPLLIWRSAPMNFMAPCLRMNYPRFYSLLFATLLGVMLSTQTAAFQQMATGHPLEPLDEAILNVFDLQEEEINLGTTVLAISRQASKDLFGEDFDTQTFRSTLDKIAMEVLSRAPKGGGPEEIIRAINSYLFGELGFSSEPNDSGSGVFNKPGNVLLNLVLQNKKGNCIGLSMCYLALCERMDFPVHGVSVPGHFLVRYDRQGQRRNIETTLQGTEKRDEVFVQSDEFPQGHPIHLRSLSKKETLAVYLRNVALLYSERKMYERAVVLLEKAVTVIPQDEGIHESLGNAYIEMGDADRADAELRKAISLNPNYLLAYVNLGAVCEKRGKEKEAIALYEKVLSARMPDGSQSYISVRARAWAHVYLGGIYSEQGKLQEAISEVTKALQLDPEMPEAHYTLGNVYAEQGSNNEAISAYQRALALRSDYLEARTNLGGVYLRQGMSKGGKKETIDKAILEFEQVLSLDPGRAKTHFNLSLAYYHRGKYAPAIEHYDRAIELGHAPMPALALALERYRNLKRR